MKKLIYNGAVLFCALMLAGASMDVAAEGDPMAEKEVKSWFEPTEPMKIVGPIHFVGTRGLATYLITTTEGHILLFGGMTPTSKLIEGNIRKLGFKPEDIKIMLTCHGHIDHVGTHAHFKKLSGKQSACL